jgi:NADH-quinone oxidoreductase subunit M
LPGLNGFVGEFLILVGAYQTSAVWAVFAATGVILAAIYMLWMVRRVFFGEITNKANKSLKDLNVTEWLSLAPLLIFIVWIGVHPNTFLSKFAVSIEHFLTQVVR